MLRLALYVVLSAKLLLPVIVVSALRPTQRWLSVRLESRVGSLGSLASPRRGKCPVSIRLSSPAVVRRRGTYRAVRSKG